MTDQHSDLLRRRAALQAMVRAGIITQNEAREQEHGGRRWRILSWIIVVAVGAALVALLVDIVVAVGAALVALLVDIAIRMGWWL